MEGNLCSGTCKLFKFARMRDIGFFLHKTLRVYCVYLKAMGNIHLLILQGNVLLLENIEGGGGGGCSLCQWLHNADAHY